jgi:tetratricopeptide (TPR) repeat protein
MTDNQRLEDLRRRLQKDPASIAFAQLGEELRRAGQYQEAIDVCRAGLASYPSYLSARVTVGRALIALNRLDEAKREIEDVLKTAPDHLTAARALDTIRSRQDSGDERQLFASHRSHSIDDAQYVQVARTLVALESWLSAIHGARARRSA